MRGVRFYRTRYVPDHQRADVTGRVPLHVVLMEKLLGGPVEKGLVIHHKDWNKLNNPEDGSNYQLMSRTEHQQIPEMQGRFLASKGLLNEFFKWWETVKDRRDEERELMTRLALAEEEQDRINVRIQKRDKKARK